MLSALLVCVPGGTKSTYAGKKRREASIDRLRDRNPSERWKSLQKMWQPFSDDDAAAADRPSEPPQPGTTHADTRAVDAGGAEADRNEQPVFVRPVPPAGPQRSHETTSSPAAGPGGGTAESAPVWVFDDADDQDPTGRKRSSNAAVMTSLQTQGQDDPMLPPKADTQTLKPISEIDPYYFYIPEETRNTYRNRSLSEENLQDELCMHQQGDGLSCPKLLPLPENGFEERVFAETYVAWEPTNLFSNPLYFEDASLERYGHTHGCLQPVVSLGKFSAQLVGLPYQMALHPVHERRYALGWYRPGEWAPHKYYLPPWNTKAALTAGAAYTGLIFLIP